MDKAKTAWGKSAQWYDDLLEKETGTYQRELILPSLLRLFGDLKDKAVLDLACGQGFFAREFAKAGAQVVGVDAAKPLIELAKKRSDKSIVYHTAPADDLGFLKTASIDTTVIVLALQNIANLAGVFKECARVLKQGGRLFFVINHPAFRVPKNSSWGFDEGRKIQYRRIDAYISESKANIQMHPSASSGQVPAADIYTISFHRPLQSYFKALAKAGFAVTRLEEWNSHKKSEPGPRQGAEDRARREIPLFLAIEAKK